MTFRFPDIRARVDRDADTLPPSTPYSVEEVRYTTVTLRGYPHVVRSTWWGARF